jgi:hypothetical protein
MVFVMPGQLLTSAIVGWRATHFYPSEAKTVDAFGRVGTTSRSAPGALQRAKMWSPPSVKTSVAPSAANVPTTLSAASYKSLTKEQRPSSRQC